MYCYLFLMFSFSCLAWLLSIILSYRLLICTFVSSNLSLIPSNLFFVSVIVFCSSIFIFFIDVLTELIYLILFILLKLVSL